MRSCSSIASKKIPVVERVFYTIFSMELRDMFKVNDYVQIINHSEPACNGQYGTIHEIQVAYNGRTLYYMVTLDDSFDVCSCIDDELMEA